MKLTDLVEKERRLKSDLKKVQDEIARKRANIQGRDCRDSSIWRDRFYKKMTVKSLSIKYQVGIQRIRQICNIQEAIRFRNLRSGIATRISSAPFGMLENIQVLVWYLRLKELNENWI